MLGMPSTQSTQSTRGPGITPGTATTAQRHLDENGLKLGKTMLIESNEAIKHAVMSGLGISILSEHTLTYGGDTGLATLKVKELPIDSIWYLVRLRSRRLSPIAQIFLDYLQDEGIHSLELH